MKNMKKPVSIWMVIILISAFGLYSAIYALGHNAALLIWTILSLIAAYGLFRNKSWSQFLVYVLAAVVIFAWSYSLLYSFDYGWHDEDTGRKILSLLPGIVIVIITLLSCIFVYRHFRKQRNNK
jgi:uncharacterized membrane protein (DUF2068 family)